MMQVMIHLYFLNRENVKSCCDKRLSKSHNHLFEVWLAF